MNAAVATEDVEPRVIVPAALRVFRRYVTDFVNRHDFSVLPEIMHDDYTLITSGLTITGRDGPYRSAVEKQFAQFPDLGFTVHELFVVDGAVAVRFTEHGAQDDGRAAAWPSIAIYEVCEGRLARCTIEQDYMSRRRQLADADPVQVDFPAAAPWDECERSADPQAERAVRNWLGGASLLDTPGVQVDDARATGVVAKIVESGQISVTKMVSGDGRVAFHAEQRGALASDFGYVPPRAGLPVHIHMSGLVHVVGGTVIGGNVVRDRLGLSRRLERNL